MTSPLIERRRAVFLDKDGTLCEDTGYGIEPKTMTLLENAAAALRMLSRNGFELIVVSNQSGVARGIFPEAALKRATTRLEELFEAAGVRCAGVYYCPHHPEGSVPEYATPCSCRKPEPGLLIRAAADHGIELSSSWMVGDKESDVEAGRRAGCSPILLSPELPPEPATAFVAQDLLEAAELIVRLSLDRSNRERSDSSESHPRLR